MLVSGIPYKFSTPWAADATTKYITATIPATAAGAAASQQLGFPPATATPIASGGTSPNIADINGVMNYATAWNQWQQAGGPIYYDGTFATAVGGYPKGAVLQSSVTAGLFWISTADSNATNPDSGGAANWTSQFAAPWTWAATQTFGAGVVASGQDANGANFRAVGTASGVSTGAMLRNDGISFYVMLTAPGSPLGSWTTARPWTVNVTTAAVSIDATGAGVTIGASGSTTAVLGALTVQNAAASNQPVALGQLPATLSTTGSQHFPSGLIWQWGYAAGPFGTSPNVGFSYALPNAFPSACLSVTATPANPSSNASYGQSILEIVNFNATTINLFSDAIGGQTTGWGIAGFFWMAIGY